MQNLLCNPYSRSGLIAGLLGWIYSAAAIPPNSAEMISQKSYQCPHCDLRGGNFESYNPASILEKANPKAASCTVDLNLSEANLSYSKLDRSQWVACQRGEVTPFRAIHFDKANLAHSSLVGFTAYGVSFQKAHFNNSNLTDAVLSLCDFSHATFAHANLTRATSKRDAMHGWGTQFTSVYFVDANLSHANLYGVFSHANFSHANLTGAILTSSTEATYLPSNEKKETETGGASLWAKTDFTDANLTGAKLLEGSDNASNSNNRPADLSQAILCRTVMPDGSINHRNC